jgi:hypothetical protein
MKKRKPPCEMRLVEEDRKRVIYIEVEGKRITKRGVPGTPEGSAWITLEPGYRVRHDDGDTTIEYHGVTAN